MSLVDPEQTTPLQHIQRSLDLVSRAQRHHQRHPSNDHAKHNAMSKHDHHSSPYLQSHSMPPPPQRKSSQTVVSCIVSLVISKLLEALLFTSALALAAYNYYKGDLHKPERIEASPAMYDNEHDRIMDIRQWRHMHPPLTRQYHHHHHHHPRQQRESFQDSKRRRTLEWAESMARQSQHSRTNSSGSSSSSRHGSSNSRDGIGYKHDIPSDIVSPSLQRGSVTVTDVNSTVIGASTDTSGNDKERQDDEMFTRMEEQLQSLIEQGQAALTSKANDLDELDDQELAMRKAFAGV
ncbi:hypothetical protein K492DRAFT_208320 [Lichtheimia hyalospora FSU 10163]|nr:hypothetical protein K492DRAFT_208320 [Lichtheimia hyalospora FSU 10163]